MNVETIFGIHARSLHVANNLQTNSGEKQEMSILKITREKCFLRVLNPLKGDNS